MCPAEVTCSSKLQLQETSSMGCIAGVGSVESSFLIQTSPGITTYDHADLPALMVFMEYLCALEVSHCERNAAEERIGVNLGTAVEAGSRHGLSVSLQVSDCVCEGIRYVFSHPGSMYSNVEHGLLYFILFKSTHVVKAYEESKKIVVWDVECLLVYF